MKSHHEKLREFGEKHGIKVEERSEKKVIKEQLKGKDKSKLSTSEKDALLIQIAKDFGYLD